MTVTTRVNVSVNTASLVERVTTAPPDSTDTQNASVRFITAITYFITRHNYEFS